jgi:beta-N-acetylglucosaminidase
MRIKRVSYVLLGVFLMFSIVVQVSASTTGTIVVDDYLNVRNSITGSSIGKLNNGSVVDVLDINAGSNSLCSSWYKIQSGSITGYACGSYITLLKGYASCEENSDPVNLWKDTNKSSKVTSVTCDKEMTILDKDINKNSKCSNNWYKVKYGNYTGYACSTYVYLSKKVEVTNTYNRPWTSPKKSIIGGAEFIAENYISKGQYTSYLKKFNVNPNSVYSTYNHQYMANLAAPSSEAKSSYTSYSNNSLLSLPLHFVIPTYTDMPDFTFLPGSSADTSGQSNVSDSNFEILLNNQGFDETYKKKLRSLHSKYPNWTFENMKTGLKFSSAVSAEQAVSSISGNSDYYYKNASGNYVSTESGWYLANTGTVSYYLDPRNFLTEKGILMFESLKYSANYTDSVVQSVLNGTFMKDKSTIDNQSYASIFTEAGKNKNVSPIYLASLAKQESGTNGSIATTGAQFSYKNVTYTGLYNFFNIGAYSTEESPIKAGLVWASGGSSSVVVTSSTTNSSSNNTTTNNSTTNNGSSNSSSSNSSTSSSGSSNNTSNSTSTQTVKNNGTTYYTSKLGVKNNSGYVNGLSVGTTVSSVVSKLAGAKSASVVNVSGKAISGNTKVGTGSVIRVVDQDDKTTYNYTVVMYGDVNGDGVITASDYILIKNYIMKKTTLSQVSLKGADSNKNGTVTASDYVVIKNYILGKTNISQS